ncbi:hypothetical protein INT43_005807 [Umbelopsis isabellina]|uniref:Uncharacterized protein n=1 Tax=Mortierella isabellina TaxID=91625 RepID=A0A8H7PIL8_MORIS|nr:hypothetical protein INT43_005807 [Umbelopsis isabellina]
MPSQTRKSYLKNRIKGEFQSTATKNMDKSEYELHIIAGETQLETLQIQCAHLQKIQNENLIIPVVLDGSSKWKPGTPRRPTNRFMNGPTPSWLRGKKQS